MADIQPLSFATGDLPEPAGILEEILRTGMDIAVRWPILRDGVDNEGADVFGSLCSMSIFLLEATLCTRFLSCSGMRTKVNLLDLGGASYPARLLRTQFRFLQLCLALL